VFKLNFPRFEKGGGVGCRIKKRNINRSRNRDVKPNDMNVLHSKFRTTATEKTGGRIDAAPAPQFFILIKSITDYTYSVFS
jgi:hypothetical protein